MLGVRGSPLLSKMPVAVQAGRQHFVAVEPRGAQLTQ